MNALVRESHAYYDDPAKIDILQSNIELHEAINIVARNVEFGGGSFNAAVGAGVMLGYYLAMRPTAPKTDKAVS